MESDKQREPFYSGEHMNSSIVNLLCQLLPIALGAAILVSLRSMNFVKRYANSLKSFASGSSEVLLPGLLGSS